MWMNGLMGLLNLAAACWALEHPLGPSRLIPILGWTNLALGVANLLTFALWFATA